MAQRGDRPDCGGFTLVEIMIALAIVGIVVMLATSTFQGMTEKYRVEGETKQMFADLMDARGRAMQRNRWFFVRIASTGYKTYEDSSPAPDGNGPPLDDTADALVTSATVRHAINTNLAGGNDFGFNRNGIANDNGAIWFTSTTQPDYDCITIKPTRIKMGRFLGGVCVEK
jgi:prepilin-type N-terminal cleavage/methylation domain-containing protein